MRTTAALVLIFLAPILSRESIGDVADENKNKVANESAAFFRARIAPVLEKKCVSCHDGATPKGKLALTNRAALLIGGESGPSIVPGQPDASPLLDMVAGDPPEMPAKGEPLSAESIADLRRWVGAGAHWPEGLILRDRRFDGETWWAFTPLVPPLPPELPPKWRADARNPIDAFLRDRLAQEELSPSTEADPRTLIRRVSFDLLGLPPTPEEIETLENDARPDAYERLVDRMLASPRYGERWGRHWLDVAHYGDTHGYDKDKRRDHAWPYRDWVIRAFNSDMPYAEFVRQQIAGDVLHPGDPDGVIATGFVAAGPWDFVGHVELREGTVDKAKARLVDRDDMVSTTFGTFQSLTVHCARCHDHKFDPIPQAEYYRLQADFAGVERGDRDPTLDRRRTLTRARDDIQTRLSVFESALKGHIKDDVPHTEPRRRVEGCRVELARINTELAALPTSPLVYSLLPREPRPIHVLNRGEVEQPLAEAPPGALSCVPGLPSVFEPSASEGARRAALAEWLSSPKNMLTWRSMANRVWLHHFCRGLVDTPNDFGRNGSRPSHPELLDWLACVLRDSGSIKSLHKMILTSAAYRQVSRGNPAFESKDAGNRYVWRQDRRRLEAESIRDAVLFVTGTLSPTMYGPGFDLFRFKDDHSPTYDHTAPGVADNPAVRRRTVYRFAVRSVPNPFLECLDCPDPSINTPVRPTTITALQALALWNDPFIESQSRAFAYRLEGRGDVEKQVETACRLALGRPPRADERASLAEYAARFGLPDACRVLLNSNEFMFAD